jgi:hypothetical protein
MVLLTVSSTLPTGQRSTDGLRAARPAALEQFGVEGGGVGEALVLPLGDPGLERVELRFPVPGLDE